MNENIQIEKLDIKSVTYKQAADLVDFHNKLYGTQREPENWFWQYSSFEPEKAIFTVAKDQEKIIGTQAMMPVYLRVGNKNVLSGKSENTLLSPEYRGKQVMEELYEFAVHNCEMLGLDFLWGFTAATKAFRRFGFEILPGFQAYEKPGYNILHSVSARLKRNVGLKKKIGSATKFMVKYLSTIRNVTLPKFEISPEFEIICEQPNEGAIRHFLDRLNTKYSFIISLPYDTRYLKWRVREHPFLSYKEYYVYKKGLLQAFAYVVLFEGTIAVSDLTSETEDAAATILFRILSDNMYKSGKFIIIINPKDLIAQPIKRVLKDFGFSENPTQSFVLRDLSGGKHGDLADMAQWHITGLWSEGSSM